MKTEELIRELPKGLLAWYDFHSASKALCITAKPETDSVFQEMLQDKDIKTDVIDIHSFENNVGRFSQDLAFMCDYHYIVMVGALECSKNPECILNAVRKMLHPEGKLLIGADNRLGIRYFCGDRDAYTERNFDGIENYAHIDPKDRDQMSGRAYAKAELVQMLHNAGFMNYRFYSIFPVLERPQVIYAEDHLPEEELEVRLFPQYHYPDTVFLEEERLYTTLIQNGLFHAMANGYLIECTPSNGLANVKQVTVSMERGRENAMFTIIRRDDKVEKKPVYRQGLVKLDRLIQNTWDLQQHGIKMVDLQKERDAVIMPYVKGEPVTDYFRKLLRRDREAFLSELDRFWNLIVNSSESVPYEEMDWERFEPDWEKRKADDPNWDKWKKIAFGTEEDRKKLGVILRRGYIDLVSLNCFYVDGEFVFYDQELYIENLPAKAILERTIRFIYHGNSEYEALLPQKQLEERYQLSEYMDLWNKFISFFLNKLRNDLDLAAYNKMYRKDPMVINSNRQRMNYLTEEYDRLFGNIFDGIETRKLYLFGSGNFTKLFMSRFGKEYEIEGIVDNDSSKWGQQLFNIPIYEPNYLQTLSMGSYKVIVCIKNYVPVMKQLIQLGIRDFGIFDSNKNYSRKVEQIITRQKKEDVISKKYHIGYIAGVFDLFHIGHLNLLRRAKEQCDYLIVGVVNDESVVNNKRTMPYIPFAERIEIVRSCRYVDEAVEIPTDYNNTDEAYRRYHFDVQFSGSDYENDPIWLSKKTWLQKQGADLVFFPYTQSTSSTKIKDAIRTKNPVM